MMRRLAALHFFLVLVCTLIPSARAAERLHLTADLRAAILTVCPDCGTRGVIACGDAAVETGPRYFSHALLGEPPRGFLMSWPLGDADLRHLAETLPLAAADLAAKAGFEAATLVALEPGGKARSLGHPTATVAFPPALHACLADPAKPWGCCVADCGAHECCEKSLGSPRIELAWRDAESGERLTFRWSRNGSSLLMRRGSGFLRADYFCLVWAPLRLD
ncbi:hypothetical protein [Zavarzinia sp.]|uniref:hypothetical protein n=1 Tax=Zavarzinia sp. TaxID=2027920 RepID=UPI0035633458